MIKSGQHTGYYSTNEETFFVEKDLIKDEKNNLTVPHSGEICEKVTEQNYVFEMSQKMFELLAEWQ